MAMPSTQKPSARAAKKARRPRVKGRPGPLPSVLAGYQENTGRWLASSPAGRVLAALRTGASWEIAAKVAHVAELSPTRWNERGAEIAAALAEDDTEPADDAPLETLAYLHFHQQAQHARVAPVHAAIGTIVTASNDGSVAAADLVLKRHPAAREYRPAETHELTGENGGPLTLSVDVKAEARAVLESMVERIAANTPKPLAEETPE
jgi:hypothetical protein